MRMKMNRLFAIILAFCLVMGSVVPAYAATPYSYTAEERDEIERFLTRFLSFRDYNIASYRDPGTMFTYLLGSFFSVVSYNWYPVKPPEEHWFEDYSDPRKEFENYNKASDATVNWMFKIVFSLSDEEIAQLRAKADAGIKESYSGEIVCYRHKGYYYHYIAGAGGPIPMAKLRQMTKDGDYYRVRFLFDGNNEDYWAYAGASTRYAVFTKNSASDGKSYWSILYNGEKEPATDVPFLDVFEEDYYADSVRWAVNSGFAYGTGKYTFSPSAVCTRAQALTYLWLMSGSPKVGGATGFSDVPENAYYAEAVKWAVSKGITSGVGGGRFNPNGACTRAQIVTLMYAAAGTPSVSGSGRFSDVEDDVWYSDAVLWAVRNGITSGTGKGKFSPNSACTRAQIVTFLYGARTIL